ncbi:MAG: Holliday junction resolvase RuvX [Candidatus Doudnabacteria bacterium]|nr:Holliday junction resolvase RuvX [Candidatus Doudnabacteria bacterium]
MRILALDWGTVRIGVAISDPDGKIAFPLDKFIEPKNALGEIKKIVAELQVEKILVGWPKGLGGQATKSTDQVEKFVETLKSEIGQPLELLDERLSSIQAGNTLSAAGVSEKEQRNIKDNITAQIILQQYLDKK